MTTEELKVKITVDNSEAITKANQTKKALGEVGGTTEKGTKQATAGFEKLQKSMDQVRNLQFADMIVENLDKIKTHTDKVKKSTQLMTSGLKNAFGEMAGAFNFSNFEGAETIGDYAKSMKIQFKEAGVSIKNSLKQAGQGFVALGSMAKAALTSTIAQVALLITSIVALIGAIRNAITVSRQLKQELSEATKVGLDINTYREWGYILNSVGIEVDKLSDFLKTLAAEQNEVRAGSEDIIEAFGKLGISAEEAANSTQGDLFKKTVLALQNIENQVERTSLAYKIFGEEDAANLINVLHLNNAEMERLIENYYLLGGGASDTLINKSTRLQGSVSNMGVAWNGLKNTLAEGFMPVITAVVNWITKAIAVVNMFTRAIFGFDIVARGSSESISGAGGGIGSYTDSVKDATSAVEKLKRTTMGFDELNIVGNPNSKSGGSSDSGIGSGAAAGGAGFDMSGMSGLTESLDLGKWSERISAWGETIRALVPLAMVGVGAVGCVLAAMSGNWIAAIALATLAGFGLIAMNSGEDGFQGYCDAFTNSCNGLLAPALVAAGAVGCVIFALTGNWVGAIACGALAGFSLHAMQKGTLDKDTSNFSQKCRDLVGPALMGVGAIGAVIFGLVGNWAGVIACAALAGMGVYATSTANGTSGFDGFVTNFTTQCNGLLVPALIGVGAIGAVIGLLLGNIPMAVACLALMGAGVALSTTDTFGNSCDAFTKKVMNVVGICMTAIGIIGCIVCILTGNIPGAIMFGAMGIAGIATLGINNGWWESIGKWFQNFFKQFGKWISDLWDDITGFFGKIGGAISTAFKTAINYILEKAIDKINGFLKAINLAISIINKIPGVSIKKLTLLDVPKLAKGGIATSSTLANIGEAGREAVLPLENNTGWMDTLADRISSRNAAPTKVVLMLDGKELGYATIKNINDITKATGNLPLVLA